MQYQRLGTSGLQVSRIVLGCMGFGDRTRGTTPLGVGYRWRARGALQRPDTQFDDNEVIGTEHRQLG